MEKFPGKLTTQWVERPFRTKTGKDGCQRVMAIVLTDEQKEWLRRWFPEVENSRLMKASGMSHSTLHRNAREMKLTKSEKGMRKIMKRQTKACIRINTRNGYYDSIRGKKPSEATMEGTARMWQEIRDGKRPHPFRVMKKASPYRYRKMIMKRSESRKQLFRMERARQIYGLPQKTMLNVPMTKYTRSQLCHRSNALKRGYFYMEDCREGSGYRYVIYYDSDTKRSKLFEKNLVKDGFKVIEYEEENETY